MAQTEDYNTPWIVRGVTFKQKSEYWSMLEFDVGWRRKNQDLQWRRQWFAAQFVGRHREPNSKFRIRGLTKCMRVWQWRKIPSNVLRLICPFCTGKTGKPWLWLATLPTVRNLWHSELRSSTSRSGRKNGRENYHHIGYCRSTLSVCFMCLISFLLVVLIRFQSIGTVLETIRIHRQSTHFNASATTAIVWYE